MNKNARVMKSRPRTLKSSMMKRKVTKMHWNRCKSWIRFDKFCQFDFFAYLECYILKYMNSTIFLLTRLKPKNLLITTICMNNNARVTKRRPRTLKTSRMQRKVSKINLNRCKSWIRIDNFCQFDFLAYLECDICNI